MKKRKEPQAASSKQQAKTSHKLPGPRPISKKNKGLIHRRRKRQATSHMNLSPQALKIHEAWAIENGYQAPSHKRQAAGVACDILSHDNLPVYNGSDYRPMDPGVIESREERKRINRFRATSRKLQAS